MSIKLTVSVKNFNHHTLISSPAVCGIIIVLFCNISVFAYTFCKLLDFSQKLNMILLDFHNTQSKIHSRIILKLLSFEIINGFGFHINQCKTHGDVVRS